MNNTYVYIEVRKDHLVGTKSTKAESFRDALIDFDFYPYDPWEDYAASMNELGILSDERLEKLRPDSGIAYSDELKETVADYAVKHWCSLGYYILEILPDGSVISHPEKSNRMAVD